MKKTLILALLICGLTLNGFSQSTKQPIGDSIILPTIKRPLQEMPYFKGGPGALRAFLDKTIVYPAQAAKDKLEGRAYISFVIEKDGSLSNFKIMNEPGGGLGSEAIRVLKQSPKWSPGKLEDQIVRVQFAMPVTFKLPVSN